MRGNWIGRVFMSEWTIDPALFEKTDLLTVQVREHQREYARQLREAEKKMGCPIEVVRSEWDGLNLTTWYRAAQPLPEPPVSANMPE